MKAQAVHWLWVDRWCCTAGIRRIILCVAEAHPLPNPSEQLAERAVQAKPYRPRVHETNGVHRLHGASIAASQ